MGHCAVNTASGISLKRRSGPFRVPEAGFIAPILLFLGVFFYWPLFEVLTLSVTEPRIGLQNYEKLLFSGLIHEILWTTLRVTLLTTMASVGAGYLIAYAIVHATRRTQKLLLLLTILTFWMSITIRAAAWLILLRGNGLVNTFLMETGLINAPLELSRNELGVLIGITHIMIPIAALTILANLKGINANYVKAARSLGASPWFAFWTVYLPISRPGLIGASMIVFMFTLGFFITPSLLGGGRVIMVAEYISVKTLFLSQFGEPAMLAAVLMAFVFLLLTILGRFVNVMNMLSGRRL